MGNGRKSTNQALYLSVLAASAIGAGTYLFDGYASAWTATQEFSSPNENGRDVYSCVRVDVMGRNTLLPLQLFSIHGKGDVDQKEYDFGGDDSVEYVLGGLGLWLGKNHYSINGGFRHGCVLADMSLPSGNNSQLFSVCLDHLIH